MPDYFVRLIPLPRTVEGVSLPNNDGSFDIYINSLLPESRRQQVLEHELKHIRQEHFYIDLPVRQLERQAQGESINPILNPPANHIAVFNSLDSLNHTLQALFIQYRINL